MSLLPKTTTKFLSADQQTASWNNSHTTKRPTAQNISTFTPDGLGALERLSLVEQTYSYSSPRTQAQNITNPENAPVQRESDLHTPPPPFIPQFQETRVSSVTEQICNDISAVNEFKSPTKGATTWQPIVINFVPISTNTSTALRTSTTFSSSSVAVTVNIPQFTSTPIRTTANISSTAQTIGNNGQLSETVRKVIYTASKQQQHILPKPANNQTINDSMAQIRKDTVESL